MTTSESKGRFFYKTNLFESIGITNRIYSNRELEYSRCTLDAEGLASLKRGRKWARVVCNLHGPLVEAAAQPDVYRAAYNVSK